MKEVCGQDMQVKREEHEIEQNGKCKGPEAIMCWLQEKQGLRG